MNPIVTIPFTPAGRTSFTITAKAASVFDISNSPFAAKAAATIPGIRNMKTGRIPVMMSLGSLYDYLQGIQSLLAPAMVAVFALGIFSKKITPKAGETAMIVGFLIGMLRLLTNILTNTGKDVMTGWFWENTTWFWQTNWLIDRKSVV